MAISHHIWDSARAADTKVDFTSNLKPAPGTWQFSITGDGFAVSTFTAVAKGSDVTVMAAVQVLSEQQERCRLYWEAPTHRVAVWYTIGADAESEKRALVREIGIAPLTESSFTPTLGMSGAKFAISIVYLEEWEDRVADTIVPNLPTVVGSLGGTYTISAISGSLPARIAKMGFGGGPAETLYKVWCGIRPTGLGVSSFRSVWELESGTAGTDTALATDADAGPGAANNCMQVTFVTSTMAQRVYMLVEDGMTANYTHIAGRYNILLRCKLSAAGECTARMYSGYGSTLAPGEYKSITWTAWKLVSLGEINIPPVGAYSVNTNALYPEFKISVYAEKNSGSPNLLLDSLVFIPSDHYTTSIGLSIGGGGFAEHYVFDDGRHGGLSEDSAGDTNSAPEIGMRNWELPIGGGILVVAAERSAAQVRTDTINLYMTAHHRHRTFND